MWALLHDTEEEKYLYLSMYKYRSARVSRYVFAAIWFVFQDIFFLFNFFHMKLSPEYTIHGESIASDSDWPRTLTCWQFPP